MKNWSHKATLTAGVAVMTMVFSAGALAQFQGPSASERKPASGAPVTQEAVRTVQWVKDNGRDDQRVLLRGRVINHVRGDDYTFADDSGEIRVEIDHDVFGGQVIDQNTLVEIWGEIDFDDGRFQEIDVKSLRVVK